MENNVENSSGGRRRWATIPDRLRDRYILIALAVTVVCIAAWTWVVLTGPGRSEDRCEDWAASTGFETKFEHEVCYVKLISDDNTNVKWIPIHQVHVLLTSET